MMTRLLPIALLVLTLVGGKVPRPLKADLFILHGGGRIEGVRIDDRRADAKQYVIRTEAGFQVTLEKSRVEKIVRQQDKLKQYEQIAPDYADTLQQQWELSEWCRKNNLPQQRAVHLRRVIEHDPDYAPAWRGLGYSQLGGKWIQGEAWRKKHGYVYYRGRWRQRQEIELIEKREKAKQLKQQWLVRLKRWRKSLASPRFREVQQQFLALRDPQAVEALIELLSQEKVPAFRLLYVEALGSIPHESASAALVLATLNHPDREVFFESLEQLKRRKPSGADRSYVKALKDANNARINRAAYALSQLDSQSSIGPLIDALVTTHQVVYVPPEGGDSITTTFTRPAGGSPAPTLCRDRGVLSGLSAGNKSQVIPVRVQNREVLSALLKLSGVPGFGYDERAWRNWYDQESRRSSPRDVRRN